MSPVSARTPLPLTSTSLSRSAVSSLLLEERVPKPFFLVLAAEAGTTTMPPQDRSAPPEKDSEDAGPPAKRRRLGVACNGCRAKKSKCDSEGPCKPCVDRGQECVYPPRRSRINHEYLKGLESQNKQLADMLLHLQQGDDPIPPSPSSRHASLELLASIDRNLSPASSRLSNDQALPLPSDNMTEPLPRNETKQAELFGHASTFDFVSQVSPEAYGAPRSLPATTSYTRHSGGGNSFFHQGNEDLHSLPRRSEADRLVDSYFAHRHVLSMYLHETQFRERYERLWQSQGQRREAGSEGDDENHAWLAVVNMVFAFGADHLHSEGSRKAPRSPYYSRAEALALPCLLQGTTIEVVQALLLLAQYLHITLELTKCWTTMGMAAHGAVTLGLHKDPAKFTNDLVQQEIRKRVFWGCFALDRVLSVKIGSTPTIQDGDAIEVTLPLPLSDEELEIRAGGNILGHIPEQPSQLNYFEHVVSLCRFTERLLASLYGEGKANRNLGTIELLSLAVKLDGELMAWERSLPFHLRFSSQGADAGVYEQQRVVLYMRFLSCRQLIHRQVLLICFREPIHDEYQRGLLQLSVKRCVSAATETVVQLEMLRQKRLAGSWWHNSYYVFSALGILLAYTLLTKCDGFQEPDSAEIQDIIQKGIVFLEYVGEHSHPLAARYVQLLQDLQRKVRPSYSINQGPQNPLIPHDANALDFSQPFNLWEGNSMDPSGAAPGGEMPTMFDPSTSLFVGFEELLMNTTWLDEFNR